MSTRSTPEVIASECSCACCGKPATDGVCRLDYYILPTKLVRKRHKERKRTANYCVDCYKAADRIPVRIGEGLVHLPKMGSRDLQAHECPGCGDKLPHDGSLYGCVVLSVDEDGRSSYNAPLAMLCSDCAENCEVELPSTL